MFLLSSKKYVLFNRKITRQKTNRIQGKLPRIGTYDVCRKFLSCFDDEIYMLDDGITTLAYFHKGLKDSICFLDNKNSFNNLRKTSCKDSKRF